ncbi:hypothetical protein NRP93_003581 [Clostridium botulinum]|nr:hypothetical protein [Clostridium botulinum]
MAKKQESLRLTFSKKNSDVQKLLEDKKEESERFVATDYICEAVRFYEKNKNKVNDIINLDIIENLIDKKIRLFKEDLLKNNIQLSETQESEIKDLSHLEKCIDDISFEDD